MRLLFPDIVFNYEFITQLSSIMLIIATFGLTSYIFLMIIIKNELIRLFMSVVAIIGFLFFSFMSIWSSEGLDKLESDNHIIYVSEYRFLFACYDKFYLKKNLLFSQYVGSADQGEDANSSYYIDGDILYITTTFSHSETERTNEIDLLD